MKRILGIGIPNGIENAMFQFGKIMVVSLISSFGTVAITANAVGNAIGVFQILPGAAIGTAAVPIISRCFGAGEENRCATTPCACFAWHSSATSPSTWSSPWPFP